MGNVEHLEKLKEGVHVWNQWINLEMFKIPDLSGAELTRLNLIEADLWAADLSNANISFTNLDGANLSNSQLFGTKLHEVSLCEADFHSAAFMNTQFLNLDLRDVKNLDKAIHYGPSLIDINTIVKSDGKIPESFLKGCGVPDKFIQHFSSLTNQPTQFYSCFMSYSSKDQDFAERLHADLDNGGVKCWYAPEDMKTGDNIRQRIDHAIQSHDKFLLILSENSIESNWVENESETAYEEEDKRKKIVLFPVRIDDAVMDADQAWAAKLRRSRHIGDFTKWKDHDSYQKAFDRLLRDLKSES